MKKLLKKFSKSYVNFFLIKEEIIMKRYYIRDKSKSKEKTMS